MICITVESVIEIARALGSRKFEYTIPDGADVLELLKCLAQSHPGFSQCVYNEDGTEKEIEITVMINGSNINDLEGLETVLKAGDRVLLMPFPGRSG